ncbi:MAG: trigger factor [Patescibacteria group bacterium]
MQTEIKQLPKSELLLTIEVPAELLTKFEDEAARRISEEVDIPGYRKGQAPKAFVIAQVGADGFFREVLNIALPRSYFEVVKEKNLQVVSRPDIKILSKTPLKYEARVGIMPEIKLKGWEKIKLAAKPAEITEKEIDEVVYEMQKYRATFKPLEREVKKGDRVEIDFQGFDEGGAPLEKTKSANHPLFIGEGTLIPGFEEELVGMKTGGKKKFPVKFPKDFHHEPLKGKMVHFEVEMKRAEETILPELNEEFVEKIMGEKKTVPAFREALKIDLKRRKEMEARKQRENELLEKFLKEAKLDAPPVLVEEEVDYMIADLKREIEGKGLKFETYMEKMKNEKRDMKKEFEPEAEKRVRVRLILNFLFKEAKIDVTEEEINTAAQRLSAVTPEADRVKLAEQLKSRGEVYLRLKNNLMLEKLFARFLD